MFEMWKKKEKKKTESKNSRFAKSNKVKRILLSKYAVCGG